MARPRKEPWLKWYPADWRGEARLRMCSRASRSLWVDLLGLMHEAEPYGELRIGGVIPTEQQLASVLGDSLKDIRQWLAELEAAQVFSRTEEGVIFSRRMVRDNQRRQTNKKNGSGGGNPALIQNDEVSDNRNSAKSDNRNYGNSDNRNIAPPDNPPDKTYILEARYQRSEGSDANASAGPPVGEETPEATTFRVGKSILGTNAGGLIAKLRRSQAFDDGRVVDLLNQARDKQNPREWVGRVIAGEESLPTPDSELFPADVYRNVL